jgi:beta-lactamase regulating signal transducer with metallopeptidase domain
MSTINTSVRSLLLMLAVALTARAADARSATDAVPPAAETVSIDGMILIVGIVAVVIVLAWICSRIGDSH